MGKRETGVCNNSSAALATVIEEFETIATANFVGRRFKLHPSNDFLSPDTGRKNMFNTLRRVTDEKEITQQHQELNDILYQKHKYISALFLVPDGRTYGRTPENGHWSKIFFVCGKRCRPSGGTIFKIQDLKIINNKKTVLY